MKKAVFFLILALVLSLTACAGAAQTEEEADEAGFSPQSEESEAVQSLPAMNLEPIPQTETEQPETQPEGIPPMESAPLPEPGSGESEAKPEQAPVRSGGQAGTAQTQPEPAQPSDTPAPTQPEIPEAAEPEPEPVPVAETQPEEPEPTPTPEPEAPKGIYDYEFDVEAIRSELIALGQSMGLTHVTEDDGVSCTPDTCSWASPVTASESFQGDNLKRALQNYVTSMPSIITAYGGEPITCFTIYVRDNGGGSYTFYFLY